MYLLEQLTLANTIKYSKSSSKKLITSTAWFVLFPRSWHSGCAGRRRTRRGGPAAGAPGPRIAADSLLQPPAAAFRVAPSAPQAFCQEHTIRPPGTQGCSQGKFIKVKCEGRSKTREKLHGFQNEQDACTFCFERVYA